MAREALAVIIRLAGQAPCRLRPLSSNVRPHSRNPARIAASHELSQQLARRREALAHAHRQSLRRSARAQSTRCCRVEPRARAAACRRRYGASCERRSRTTASRASRACSEQLVRGTASMSQLRKLGVLASWRCSSVTDEHASPSHAVDLAALAAERSRSLAHRSLRRAARLRDRAATVAASQACCVQLARQSDGLTLRSSGPPPAWHLAREAASVIIRLAGQAPCRRRPAQLKR